MPPSWGGNLKVIVLPRSLYGNLILESVKDFARETGIRLSVFRSIPEPWNPGDVALVLNSQLDSGLVELDASIRSAGLVPGKDVKIISYNEMPLNELVMGGLTVLSTCCSAGHTRPTSPPTSPPWGGPPRT